LLEAEQTFCGLHDNVSAVSAFETRRGFRVGRISGSS
jgi:hypothetical protein